MPQTHRMLHLKPVQITWCDLGDTWTQHFDRNCSNNYGEYQYPENLYQNNFTATRGERLPPFW